MDSPTTDRTVSRRPSLEDLTDKQHEVLEHLSLHKTSKEIARDLGVSQNTVDKHLTAIRRKWGTSDRYHTARFFEQLRGMDENHPPRILAGDEAAMMPSMPRSDLPKTGMFRLSDTFANANLDEWDIPSPKGLDALDRRFGRLWRIAAIPFLALLIGMVMISAVAFARTLTDLL